MLGLVASGLRPAKPDDVDDGANGDGDSAEDDDGFSHGRHYTTKRSPSSGVGAAHRMKNEPRVYQGAISWVQLWTTVQDQCSIGSGLLNRKDIGDGLRMRKKRW